MEVKVGEVGCPSFLCRNAGGKGCQVVVVANGNHPRKRACVLVSESGGRGGWWQTTTTLENERTCLCSRVVIVGDGKKLPPSKTSVRVCSGWRGVVVVVAENEVCKNKT